MALGLDPPFDLTHAYILIDGIAGVDPKIASFGSAAWANYVVNDVACEIDPREAPSGWPCGIFPSGALRPAPDAVPQTQPGPAQTSTPSTPDSPPGPARRPKTSTSATIPPPPPTSAAPPSSTKSSPTGPPPTPTSPATSLHSPPGLDSKMPRNSTAVPNP